jgi:aminoglycoside phosphotransferase (APT) family kinase protein
MIGLVMRDATDRFLERYADRLDVADKELLDLVPAALPGWILARSERFAPIHGDYRLDNLLFGEGDDPIATVDWQTVTLGLPARDLAYFLSTGLSVEDRRAHEDELVEHYHVALAAQGVRDHSLEQCLDDYRFAMLQGPLITIVGAAYGAPTERGDEMFVTMARRAAAAIRDHGTLERLS